MISNRNKSFTIRLLSTTLLVAMAFVLESATALAQNSCIPNENIQANTLIPIVVVLWQNTNFGGTKREVVIDTPNLKRQHFNDGISAVGVHPGPDFERWKSMHGGREPTVTLFSDVGFLGKSIVLRAGTYPNLKTFKMNDNISSVQFSDLQAQAIPPGGTAATFTSIPFAIVLYTKDCSEMWLIESTRSLASDYGGYFNDSVHKALVVTRTTGFTPGAHSVEFCADDFFDRCDPPHVAKAGGGQEVLTLVSDIPPCAGCSTPKPTLSSVKIQKLDSCT